MNNSDNPAMPVIDDEISTHEKEIHFGLTKREMFAMHAMQGLLSNSGGVVQANSRSGTGWCNCDEEALAEWSIACADALLKGLGK